MVVILLWLGSVRTANTLPQYRTLIKPRVFLELGFYNILMCTFAGIFCLMGNIHYVIISCVADIVFFINVLARAGVNSKGIGIKSIPSPNPELERNWN